MVWWWYNNGLRELGAPNPVRSFTWGCYRLLSGNRVAQVGRATFWEKFVKKQNRLGTRPIRPRQGRSKVGSARPDLKHNWKNRVFFEKIRFLQKTRSVGTSWAPASQRRSLVATSYASCLGDLLICKLHTFEFFCPVSVLFAQEGPPDEFFCIFFGRFSDQRV